MDTRSWEMEVAYMGLPWGDIVYFHPTTLSDTLGEVELCMFKIQNAGDAPGIFTWKVSIVDEEDTEIKVLDTGEVELDVGEVSDLIISTSTFEEPGIYKLKLTVEP